MYNSNNVKPVIEKINIYIKNNYNELFALFRVCLKSN